jgi:hypothetical protein
MGTILTLVGIDIEELSLSTEPELEELFYKLWEDDRL